MRTGRSLIILFRFAILEAAMSEEERRSFVYVVDKERNRMCKNETVTQVMKYTLAHIIWDKCEVYMTRVI